MQNQALRISALVAAFFVFTTRPVAADVVIGPPAPTVINFDDVPGPGKGYFIGGFYASSGVYVSGTILNSPEKAHSSPNVARTSPDPEFSTGPMFIYFLSGQSSVSLYGGTQSSSTALDCNGTLRAFNRQGQEVAYDGPRPFLCQLSSQLYSVTRPQADIDYVTFYVGGGDNSNNYEVVDDLTFSGNPAPPAPTTPPQITIDAPQVVGDFLTGALTVSGTISGLAIDRIVYVTVSEADQGADKAAPYNRTLDIDLAANMGNCGLCFTDGPVPFSIQFEPAGILPLGLYKVTVSATNIADRPGTATLDFENRSAVIDALNPGPIVQGRRSTNCQIGFYQDGSAWALFTDGTQRVTHLTPAVATKWLDARGVYLGGDRWLGCPTTDGLAAIAYSTWKIQEFERGRIATAGNGEITAETHFMPKVFADVADYLGSNSGEADWALQLGVPMGDPLQGSWNGNEWATTLFQQFVRPTDSEGLQGSGNAPPNTLEIRGRGGADPRLYIERVGGDLNDLKAASADITPWVQPNTPTIWESLPCTGTPGPFVCPPQDPNSIDANGPDTPPPPPLVRPYAAGMATVPGVVPTVGAHLDEDNIGRNYCPYGSYDGVSQILAWADTYPGSGRSPPFTQVDMKAFIKARDKNYGPPSTGSFMSPTDNPLVHAHKDCGCGMDAQDLGLCEAEQLFEWVLSYAGAWLCDHAWVAAITPPVGTLLLMDGVANNCQTENICPSDWNLHVRPLPRYWNHFSTNYSLADFEIEWEYVWGAYVFPDGFGGFWDGYGFLDQMEMGSNFGFVAGDMVHLNGRHVIDCGHEPFFAEIHPPNTIVDMRRQDSTVIDGMKTPDPSTRAQIWVNGFYRSTGPGVTIWAPPRPDPDAYLRVWHPVENESSAINGYPGINIKSQHFFLPEGVQVKFTSGTRFDYVLGGTGQQIYPADVDRTISHVTEHCDAENAWICKSVVGDSVCDSDPHGTCTYQGDLLRQYAGLWKVSWVR